MDSKTEGLKNAIAWLLKNQPSKMRASAIKCLQDEIDYIKGLKRE